jgi:hypothetical protein
MLRRASFISFAVNRPCCFSHRSRSEGRAPKCQSAGEYRKAGGENGKIQTPECESADELERALHDQVRSVFAVFVPRFAAIV